MSVEQSEAKAPESPIESIREIQKDRAAKQVMGVPDGRKLVCAIYLKNGEVEVDTRVTPEALLKVLGASYMALRERSLPDTHVQVPERQIILP